MDEKEGNQGFSMRVPEGSVGNLIDVIANRIEYWTAPKQLKPTLLRLQQEAAVVRVLEIARERRGPEEVNPLPNKFLVPLLEQASLEDVDKGEILIKAWAELLANGASAYMPEMLSFLDTIGQLAPEHAKVLRAIAFGHGDSLHSMKENYASLFIVDSMFLTKTYGMQSSLETYCRKISEYIAKSANVEEGVVAKFVNSMGPGRYVFDLTSNNTVGEHVEWYPGRTEKFGEFDDVKLALHVLSKLGLVEMHFDVVRINEKEECIRDVFVLAGTLSPFGVRFCETCIPEVVDRIRSEANTKSEEQTV